MNYIYLFSSPNGFLEVTETTEYDEYFSVHVDKLHDPSYPEILSHEGKQAFYRTKLWVKIHHPEMLL